MERAKELIVYWYFYFPKWVWTVVILTAFILIHIPIGHLFPVEQILKSDHPYHPIVRILTFYIFLVLAGCVLTIIVGLFMIIFDAVHNLLPDDPRKSKEDS